jgi:NADH-quinone oxidoreductase subunit D
MLNARSQIAFDGDRIQAVQIKWDSEDRPLWKTLDSMPIESSIKWIDRFCPFESISAAWAMSRTIEKAHKIVVTNRTEFLRTIYAEVQRLAWSFNYLSRVFKAMDDSIRTQQIFRLREQVFEGQEFLTGSRILPQIFCIGGIERDLSIGERKKLKALIRNIEYELRLYFRDLPMDQLTMKRLIGLLPISKEQALSMGLFGPFGQASGTKRDLRKDSPYGIYNQFEIRTFDTKSTTDWFEDKKFLESSGDALTRLRSVFFQLRQSLALIEFATDKIPEGPIKVEWNQKVDVPEKYWSEGVESGSGPLFAIACEKRLRLVSHSMRMVGVVEKLASNLYADDYELAVASLGVEFGQSDLCGSY